MLTNHNCENVKLILMIHCPRDLTRCMIILIVPHKSKRIKKCRYTLQHKDNYQSKEINVIESLPLHKTLDKF